MSFEEDLEYIKQHPNIEWGVDSEYGIRPLEHIIDQMVKAHKDNDYCCICNDNCIDDCSKCTNPTKEIIV